MKIPFKIFLVFVVAVSFNCKDVQKTTTSQLHTVSTLKDTTIIINDTLSLYYASYNQQKKLWYNLYIIKNTDSIKLIKENDLVGSELFHAISPNSKFIVLDGIIKDYVYINDRDSVWSENFMCAIVDLDQVKIIKQLQQDCDGHWNNDNQWTNVAKRIIFDGNSER